MQQRAEQGKSRVLDIALYPSKFTITLVMILWFALSRMLCRCSKAFPKLA